MVQLIFAQIDITAIGAIIGLQAILGRHDPGLNEAQRLVTVIGFGMTNASSGTLEYNGEKMTLMSEWKKFQRCKSKQSNKYLRHELNAASSQTLFGTHVIRMSELTLDDVGYDLHVSMRMGAKPSFRLDKIII